MPAFFIECTSCKKSFFAYDYFLDEKDTFKDVVFCKCISKEDRQTYYKTCRGCDIKYSAYEQYNCDCDNEEEMM
jgi:hypothetical protein